MALSREPVCSVHPSWPVAAAPGSPSQPGTCGKLPACWGGVLLAQDAPAHRCLSVVNQGGSSHLCLFHLSLQLSFLKWPQKFFFPLLESSSETVSAHSSSLVDTTYPGISLMPRACIFLRLPDSLKGPDKGRGSQFSTSALP